MLITVIYVYLCFNNVFCKYELSSETALKATSKTPSPKHQDTRTIEEPIAVLTQGYPFIASIQRLGSHYATGTLVDKRWVLTCAAEFYNVRESIKFYRVRLGSTNCKRGGAKFPVKSIQIHPMFVPGSSSYDIAMLRLAVPSKTTFVFKPLPLSKVNKNVVSAKFMTAYWPRIVQKSKILPATAKERLRFTNMRVSTQKLIPSLRCARKVTNLDASSLCLVPIQTYHSVCAPDFGSPIIARDGLWGVTSSWTSDKCPYEPAPTVFTRISPPNIQIWIEHNLNNTSNRKENWGKILNGSIIST